MFNEKTKEYISAAIGSELQNAVEKYGEKYNSNHESFAVLKEEVDETRDELIHIQNKLYNCWNDVKLNRKKLYELDVKALKSHAEKMILEAVQVCAVCDKILNGN